MMKRAKLDKPLFFIMLIFMIFGLIMILSASSMESYIRYNNSPYQYFIKQGLIYLASMAMFFIVIFIPTKNYKKLSKLFIGGCIMLLMGLTIYGYSAKNAQSWFNLGLFSLQPSELLKVAIILYMALYYENNFNKLDNQLIVLRPLVVVTISFFLICLQPDFGTAMIVILLTILMFYAVPASKRIKSTITKIMLGGVLLVLSVFLVAGTSIFKDYQLERFNFLNPCDRYQEDSGYQLCNSFIAFHNGGILGQGVGKSTQKYLYLPESYTDFIFPIIVEEWGMTVGIIVILGYGYFLYRILKIAKESYTLRNSLIAYGVFSYVFLHIAINLIGIMGIGPLTGVPLPFLSYGGSYAISLILAMALVQRVAIENNKNKQKRAEFKKIN